MVRGKNIAVVALAIGVSVWIATAASAQQCDDPNVCTTNGMCSDGECVGTPVFSGPCNDFNDCTINDHCSSMPGSDQPVCTGDDAPVGTSCQGGCGTCQQIAPGVPLICVPIANNSTVSCQSPEVEPNPCLVGRCQNFGVGNFNTTVCSVSVKTCLSGPNPCTGVCNPQTGECDNNLSRCIPFCESCNAATGQCQPANQGGACEGSDVCISQNSCQTLSGRGLCLPGAPTFTIETPTPTPIAGTPTSTPALTTPTSQPATATATVAAATPTNPPATATATPAAPTATPSNTRPPGTPTPTLPPSQCVGDCNHDGRVETNEAVTGVYIDLGILNLSTCPEIDSNQDGQVVVTDLVLAVNGMLHGCTSAATAAP